MASENGQRALRGVEWSWDPDPADDTMMVEYALLLRDGTSVRSVHDRHVEGLFATATWERILAGAGYRVETFGRPIADNETARVFVCRRP